MASSSSSSAEPKTLVEDTDQGFSGPLPVPGRTPSTKPSLPKPSAKGHVRREDVETILGGISSDLDRIGRDVQASQGTLSDVDFEQRASSVMILKDIKRLHKEVRAPRPSPHIGLGGVHHNPTQSTGYTSGPPGSGLLPRPELRDPHPITQGTYKIYDHQNPPKRSDFLEQAMFGSVQIAPRLGIQSEWQKMTGYEAVPLRPPPSSKTPFGKYVEPRRPVAAFALTPSGPIQGSDEPGLAALANMQSPVVDLTKKFSLIGH